MNHCEIVVCCIKNQLWPSSTHFVVYYFSKLPSAANSPVLTTCIISDDVIEKLLTQANLFWDNWIVIKLNLLYAKLDSSSSSQSNDTVEADHCPFPSLKQSSKNPLGRGLSWACQYTVAWPLWNCYHRFSQVLYYIFSQKQVEYGSSFMTPLTPSGPRFKCDICLKIL